MVPPKIYGLIGYPVKHSLSPLMHNAAFKALKINADYRLFEIKPDRLKDFFLKDTVVRDTGGNAISKAGIFGLNVTIPHKEAVLKFLQWMSPEVKFTGSCNVIVFKDRNTLEGWNTDGIGFQRHLVADLKFNPSGSRITILGAGGAAKAVVSQLAKDGAQSILIFDIDKDKSLNLKDMINREFPQCKASSIDSIEELDIKNTDLLINATPIGMRESDPCLIEPGKLHSRLFVYDLIYNPEETKLLKCAKEKGAQVANGLGMLLYQGARSFELWIGVGQASFIDAMKHALEEGVSKS